MKTMFGTLIFLLALLSVQESAAQSKSCDETLIRGDTLICRDFVGHKKLPLKEHFYVNDKRIFTRWWHERKHGEYEWTQRKSKGAFAKKNGPAYKYYANGVVKATTFFKHDKMIGPCREYYPSGALQQFCQGHSTSKTDGLMTNLHENGQLKAQTRWENGRLKEILAYHDEQGNDLPIGTFKDGNGTWIWVEKEKPTMAYTYKNGRIIKKSALK